MRDVLAWCRRELDVIFWEWDGLAVMGKRFQGVNEGFGVRVWELESGVKVLWALLGWFFVLGLFLGAWAFSFWGSLRVVNHEKAGVLGWWVSGTGLGSGGSKADGYLVGVSGAVMGVCLVTGVNGRTLLWLLVCLSLLLWV